MKSVGFLVWTSDIALGAEGNSLVAKFMHKSCRLIEKEINDAGGIGGKKMVIYNSRVPKGDEGVNKVLKTLKENPNIVFFNGHVMPASDQKLFDGCDIESHIMFSSKDANSHPNKFNISRAEQTSKAKAVAYFLEHEKPVSRVFFIHDGKRLANHENQFSKMHRGEFKSLNFVGYSDSSEIKELLDPLLADINDDDVIILDVGLRVFRHIFDSLNETGKCPLVIKVFGSIEGRFSKIGFPLIEMTGDNAFPYLDLEDLIKQSGIKTNDTEKSFIKDSAWRLELPLLAAYAARQAECKTAEKDRFIVEMRNALNSIDGKRDIFIGKQLTYSFNQNINLIKTNYTYQFPTSLQTFKSYPKVFYPLQFFPGSNEEKPIAVTYLYVDILRITNIDIGDGSWSSEFYLDIISPHEKPIEIVKFNNLSSINPKFEAKLMWERAGKDSGGTIFRYSVVANFDFTPETDNYPFDWQHIFISYSITDPTRFGIIQPVPEVLLDKEFLVHGWNLKDSISGVKRRKETIYESAALKKSLNVSEEARIGWTLARANSVTILKIGIPLFFLIFLVYYTLFAPFKGNSSISILTTTFLSGIALYFSTERPTPLRMTTIDLIFVFFYIINGSTIIFTGVGLAFGLDYYNSLMLALKLFIPVSFAGIMIFLWNRIRSSSKKVSIKS